MTTPTSPAQAHTGHDTRRKRPRWRTAVDADGRCIAHPGDRLRLVFEDLHIEVVTGPGCEATETQRKAFEWRVDNLVRRHGPIVARKLLGRVWAD